MANELINILKLINGMINILILILILIFKYTKY